LEFSSPVPFARAAAARRGAHDDDDDDDERMGGTAAAPSIATSLCTRLLRTAHAVDEGATISGVARNDQDATLVRLRSGADVGSVASALRRALPLAAVSVVENLVDGVTEAQVLVPGGAERRALARAHARGAPAARRALCCAKLAAAAAVGCFVVLLLST